MDANRACEIMRCVSKNGDLGLVCDDTIQWARNLPGSDKIALYCQVRDESQRLESEWRQEFAARVEIEDAALPDALVREVNLEEFLVWAASHQDRGEVMDTLEELLERATEEDMAVARKIVEQTCQEDLRPILDDYQD
jgi:hypothetical protein